MRRETPQSAAGRGGQAQKSGPAKPQPKREDEESILDDDEIDSEDEDDLDEEDEE